MLFDFTPGTIFRCLTGLLTGLPPLVTSAYKYQYKLYIRGSKGELQFCYLRYHRAVP